MTILKRFNFIWLIYCGDALFKVKVKGLIYIIKIPCTSLYFQVSPGRGPARGRTSQGPAYRAIYDYAAGDTDEVIVLRIQLPVGVEVISNFCVMFITFRFRSSRATWWWTVSRWTKVGWLAPCNGPANGACCPPTMSSVSIEFVLFSFCSNFFWSTYGLT